MVTIWKQKKVSKKFEKRKKWNNLIVPKTGNGEPLSYLTFILLQNIKKTEGGRLRWEKFTNFGNNVSQC